MKRKGKPKPDYTIRGCNVVDPTLSEREKQLIQERLDWQKEHPKPWYCNSKPIYNKDKQ